MPPSAQTAGIIVGVSVIVIIILLAAFISGQASVEWILAAVILGSAAMYGTKFYMNHTPLGMALSQYNNLSAPLNLSMAPPQQQYMPQQYSPNQASQGSAITQYMQ